MKESFNSEVEVVYFDESNPEKIEKKFNGDPVKIESGSIRGHLVQIGNAGPGWVECRITDLPNGLNVITAQANETRAQDSTPWRGHAMYTTTSVNLNANDRYVIVRFNVNWRTPLKSGIMLIYG